MKRILLLSLNFAILLAACIAQPSAQPTLSAEDQNMIATGVALTVIAQNNAAVENTPTVASSATPTPALPVVVSPDVSTITFTPEVQATSTSSGPCDRILKISDAGPLSNVRFKNKTGGQIRLGIQLWKENTYAQCGYLPNNPMSIGKDQSYVVSLPEGAYFAWAWITFKNGETSPINGNFTNSSTVGGITIEIVIQKSGISG